MAKADFRKPASVLQGSGLVSVGAIMVYTLQAVIRMKNVPLISACLATLCGLTGCMDGPFYAVKRMNPYFQSEWRKDRALGPTFEDRIEELRLLDQQIATMPLEEQQAWATRLEKVINEDPSPEVRTRAVRAIAKVTSETAERALNVASTDEVEKVRMSACKAWSERSGTDAARDMLLSLATNDESNSVRQCAIEGLAAFDDPEVMRNMSTLLEDQSPAVQYQVAQSLERMTGEKLGGDIDGWKQYVANLELPSDTRLQSSPLLQGRGEVITAAGENRLPLPEFP